MVWDEFWGGAPAYVFEAAALCVTLAMLTAGVLTGKALTR